MRKRKSLNELLRSLSDNGIIEKLKIFGGYFDIEEENKSPLTFNKLQRFDWGCQHGGKANFLSAMTRAEMPAIQCIRLDSIDEETHGLLALLESKKSLATIGISFCKDHVEDLILFWNRLIVILKQPCTPKVPLFYLKIRNRQLTKQEVSKIASTRLKKA